MIIQNYHPILGESYGQVFQRVNNGRVICKYKLLDESEEGVDRAVISITRLLLENGDLIPTFPTESSLLKERILLDKFLTINGKAVCLAHERGLRGGVPSEYIDKLFSQAIIQQPIRCSHGHSLEKLSAFFWQQRNENCPGGDHLIGPLVDDEDLKDSIQDYLAVQNEQRNTMNALMANQNGMIARQRMQEVYMQHQNTQIIALRKNIKDLSLRKIDRVEMFGDFSKLVLKLGGHDICFTIGKKIAQESLALSMAKQIPAVSLLYGVVLGIYRLKIGEHLKAVAEVGSGIISNVPGFGPGASMFMDLMIACDDVRNASKTVAEVTLELGLQNAYQVLGLDPDSTHTKEEVDLAYRNCCRIIHPDRLQLAGILLQEDGEEVQKFILAVREVIYRERGWVNEAVFLEIH